MIKLNGRAVPATVFPDNTSQVWKLPQDLLDEVHRADECTVEWDFEKEAEFMQLAQLKTLLDQYTDIVRLLMPYLPYGRQDKIVSNSSTFALKTFARLLNTLEFTEVTTYDAHNDSRAHQINNLVNVAPRNWMHDTFETVKANMYLFPDKGAAVRYGPHANARFATATKDRDPLTGLISGVTIEGHVKGNKVLIVDDICDGGMTFKLVAEAALKAGAKEVHLYVTHGIFSKGLKTLTDSGIKRIFTHKGEQALPALERLRGK